MQLVRIGINDIGGLSAFGLTLTGLTDGYALLGDWAGIGYALDPDPGGESVKWSLSSDPADAADFGIGPSPSNYDASDGSRLFLHVTNAEGDIVTKSALIRKLATTVGTALDLSYVELAAITPEDLTANWTKSGNTYTAFAIWGTALPSALVVDSADGELSGTPALGVVADATYELRCLDAYNYVVRSPFTLEITNVAPTAFSDSDWSIAVIVPVETGIGFMAVGDDFIVG